MVDIKNNAFAIAKADASDESFQAGVPVRGSIHVSSHGGNCAVVLRHGYEVLLGTMGGRSTLPDLSTDHTELFRAKRVSTEHGPRLVHADSDYDGLILWIDGDGLEFSFPPLAQGLNLWPGGDGAIEPFKYAGGPNDQRRRQLYELRHGESIVVVDIRGAVAKATCIQGDLLISSVTVEEVVAFLVERAESQNTNRAYGWAYHNLKALYGGCSAGDPSQIRRARDTMRRKYNKA